MTNQVYIKKIYLESYRNLSKTIFEFEPGLNIIYGANGVGKSNILEAISLAWQSQSFRPGQIEDYIPFNQKDWAFSMKYSLNEIENNISISYINSKKNKLQNNNKIDWNKKIQDFELVIFSPQDIHIILLDPSLRRKMINGFSSSFNEGVRGLFEEYNKVLMHRNHILRTISQAKQRLDLEHWTEILRQISVRIIQNNLGIQKIINPLLKDYYLNIFEEAGELSLQYKQNTSLDILNNKEKFNEWFMDSGLAQDEIVRGFSLFGPHRDDWIFEINNHPARIYASRGEQRSIMLAFKFSQVDLLLKKNIPTIILLDDVLSELDLGRREKILKMFPDIQKIITTAEPLQAKDSNLIEINNVFSTH